MADRMSDSMAMSKTRHRLITTDIAVVLFFANAGVGLYLGLPVFGIFITSIVVIFLPTFQFIKRPMRCDQVDCIGAAHIQRTPLENTRWYSLYLSKGHVCDTCNHLIRLPREVRRVSG